MAIIVNREHWLTRAAGMITTWYRDHGFDAKQVHASCGWPIYNPHDCAGEVWSPSLSPDGNWYVHVSPILSDTITVLGVLAHEVAHTINMQVGHRGVFLKAVRAIGLVGLAAGSEVGAKFDPVADGIIKAFGNYPFKGLTPKWYKVRKRIVNIHTCTGCGYTVMIPRRHKEAKPRCAMPECYDYHLPLQFKEEARI